PRGAYIWEALGGREAAGMPAATAVGWGSTYRNTRQDRQNRGGVRMLTFTSARASRNLVTALILALALWVGGTGVAFGHAHLREARPAQGSTVTELPAEVALKFSEPVEIGFSTFKVYPLAPEEDEAALRAAARQLMEEVLTARDDEGARA